MILKKKTKGNRFQLCGKYSNIKYLACCAVICVSTLLAACNTGTSNIDNGYEERGSVDYNTVSIESNLDSTAQIQEWVYVPEKIVIEDKKADYGNMQLIGSTVCYIPINGEAENDTQCICRYSLDDKELTSSVINWPMEESNREIRAYTFNQDYSVCMIVNIYNADYSQLRRFLCKFDSEGNNIFSQEVTGQLGRDIDINSLATDSQGRIYVFTSEAEIELYEGEGNYQGSISYDSSESVRVKGTANGDDNKFYACIPNGEDSSHNTLLVVDFDKKQITETIKDFPNINGFGVDSARQYDLLLYDDFSAYGYEFSTQKKEELFAWMDSDINGYFVKSIYVLEDGRYYVTVEDGGHDDNSIVLLTRTRIEEAPQRENMVLATINGGSELNGMAVSFNRSNNRYHITVKNYDSQMSLYNAILAKENIDIIDLSGVNVVKLSEQGVFEDLMPYIDQSSTFDRSDFLDGILDAYTFDGILVGIPETFIMRTVVGDRTQLGNNIGLSLDGLLAISERNSEAFPFEGMTKEEMMRCIMMFSEEAFIDWNAGECHFDSERFKAVLELVNRFPSELGIEQEKVSLPNKIHNGEVLFAIADIDGLKSFQPYEGMFGENAAGIGFPTVDGKGGTLLFASNAFGVLGSSKSKSGAWEFIEGVLSREKLEYHEAYRRYFPALKKILNNIIDFEMEQDSQRPNDRYTRRVYEDGWTFTFHAITWDEINVILDLVKEATPSFYVEDNEIIKIINEEAGAYYSGQKGVEDVISIIQNRVQLYVNENS